MRIELQRVTALAGSGLATTRQRTVTTSQSGTSTCDRLQDFLVVVVLNQCDNLETFQISGYSSSTKGCSPLLNIRHVLVERLLEIGEIDCDRFAIFHIRDRDAVGAAGKARTT